MATKRDGDATDDQAEGPVDVVAASSAPIALHEGDEDEDVGPRRRGRDRDQRKRAKRRERNLCDSVNAELEVIFIAVPKTGTTTVRKQISPGRPYLFPHPHLNIMQVRELLYVSELTRSLSANDQFPSRGLATDAELRTRAREKFERYFKFASVRNPWARAVSLYFRSEGLQLSERMTFKQFCVQHQFASDTCYHPSLHRDQLDWLVDESGAMAMDYVYKIEEFADKIGEIREASGGRVNLEAMRLNVNDRSKSTSYRDVYDEETRQLIARRFERDIDTFKYSF